MKRSTAITRDMNLFWRLRCAARDVRTKLPTAQPEVPNMKRFVIVAILTLAGMPGTTRWVGAQPNNFPTVYPAAPGTQPKPFPTVYPAASETQSNATPVYLSTGNARGNNFP